MTDSVSSVSVSDALSCVPLADCMSAPALLPVLAALLESTWPDWYGAGGRGDARADLARYAQGSGVPFGMVLLQQGKAIGFAALKNEGFGDWPGPWLGAATVQAALRGQGLGSQLFGALEAAAQAQGFASLYAATSTAASLLARRGWLCLQPQQADQPGIWRLDFKR